MIELIFLGFIAFGIYKAFTYKPSNQQNQAQQSDIPGQVTYSMTNQSLADQLEAWAALPEYQAEAAHYRALAASLRHGQAPHQLTEAPLQSGLETQKTTPAPLAPSTSLASNSTQPHSVSETPAHQPIDVAETLKNVNVLLFVGAFLVVVSVMILVGSNFDAISDEMKMLLVALGTISFYAGGLWLYNFRKRLRPAGITFTLIGMLLIPLMGVAYRNLLSDSIDSYGVWFVTSIFSSGAYLVATRILRQPLLQYATILALLSTMQSGLLSLDAPIQVSAWVALGFASVLLYVDRKKLQQLTWQEPVGLSAMVLIPLVIIASFARDSLSWELAITLALSAVFYIQAAWYAYAYGKDSEQSSSQYFTIGSSLLALAPLVALIGTDYSWIDTTLIMSGVGFVYLAVSALLVGALPEMYQRTVWTIGQIVAGVSFVVGISLYADDLHKSLIVTLIGIAFYSLAAWQAKRNTDASIALFAAAFVLVGIAGRMIFALEAIDNGLLPVFYLGLGLLFSLVSTQISRDMFAKPYSALLIQFARISGLVSVVSLLLYADQVTATNITVLLAAAAGFYLYTHAIIARSEAEHWKLDYVGFLVLSQLAVFAFGLDVELNGFEIGALLSAAAFLVAGIGLLLVWSSKAAAARGRLHAPVSAVLASLGALMALGDSSVAAIALAFAGSSQLVSAYLSRKPSYLWIFILAVLALPFSIFGYLIDLDSVATGIYQVSAFAGITGLGFTWRYQYQHWFKDSQLLNTMPSIAFTLYNLALIGMFIAALLYLTSTGIAVVALLLIVAFWLVSDYEQLPAYHVLIVGLVFIITILTPSFSAVSSDDIMVVVLVSGVLQFCASLALADSRQRATIWRIGSVIALTISLLSGVAVVSIASQFVLGLVVGIEAYRSKVYTLIYVAAGVQVLALNRLLLEVGIDDLHINGLLWTAYAAALAWIQHRKGQKANRDSWLLVALFFQTIPLGLQALDAETTSKGLLLMVESAAILIIGFSIRVRLLITWGAVVIIAQVLYQTRSVIGAIPKQVFTLAIGMMLLGVAIYYLSRAKDDS